jgi:hypothetical protein
MKKMQKEISRRDKMLVEISSRPKVTCGAAAVFQVICSNPHVMHKDHVVSTERRIPNGMQSGRNRPNFDLCD